MGTRIVLSGDFSAHRLFTLPPDVPATPILWSFFGTGNTDGKNLVPGGVDFANIGGGPTSISDAYMTCHSGTNGIDTGIADDPAFPPLTVFGAARMTEGQTPSNGRIMGTWTRGVARGFEFALNHTNDLYGFAPGTNGGALSMNIPGGTTGWHLFAYRLPGVSDALPAKIFDITDGTSAVLTGNFSSYGATTAPPSNLYVGTVPGALLTNGGNDGGDIDIGFAAAFRGTLLDDAHVASIGAALRTLLQARGLTGI